MFEDNVLCWWQLEERQSFGTIAVKGKEEKKGAALEDCSERAVVKNRFPRARWLAVDVRGGFAVSVRGAVRSVLPLFVATGHEEYQI